MKKIIKINIFCLLIVAFVSSCGTNGSITKRHYTKGYYVAHSKGKHKVSAENKDFKVAQQKEIETIFISSSNQTVKDNFANNSENGNKVLDKSTLFASPVKKPVLINTRTVFKNQLRLDPVLKASSFKGNKHSIFIKSSAASSEDDGLSLLWIVIVVLLVLWALGLISGGFGLGGLINILLLIALILLILWLLRII